MKLQVLSDLHLEMGDYAPVPTDADVVVLAGDIHIGREGVGWINELPKHRSEKTVVVTHHAPSEKSAAPQHVGDILTGAFVSPLDDFVKASGVLCGCMGTRIIAWITKSATRGLSATSGVTLGMYISSQMQSSNCLPPATQS